MPAAVLSILEENQRILKNKLNECKIKKLKSLQSGIQPQTGNLIKFSFPNLTLTLSLQMNKLMFLRKLQLTSSSCISCQVSGLNINYSKLKCFLCHKAQDLSIHVSSYIHCALIAGCPQLYQPLINMALLRLPTWVSYPDKRYCLQFTTYIVHVHM